MSASNTETTQYAENQSLDDQFKTVCDDIHKLNGTAKNLIVKVKELQKSVKSASKPKKVKKHTVMHDPMNISSDLLKYLKQPAGTKLTKSEET